MALEDKITVPPKATLGRRSVSRRKAVVSSPSEIGDAAAIASGETDLAALVEAVRACRICRDDPQGTPLPHEPRPVLRASRTARICLASQAPGTRVHASGIPFTDPSGDRLRAWMGVTADEFYDDSRIAILPMGFCFPGLDVHGGDLPPRRECAATWRAPLFAAMPQFELILLVGGYAQRWHMGKAVRGGTTAAVEALLANIRAASGQHWATQCPLFLPLPHPSWRNSGWLKRNPWFDAEVVPFLQSEVRRLLA
jgi:uracil-DNA glycosylase